jgi:NAD(P)-dependent dehydrogenase (short-subunit alcohol dehydrogenase family)
MTMTPSHAKTVLVTGATSGIGLAVVKLLLKNRYSVFAVGSRPERAETAKKNILSEQPDADLEFFSANLANQREIRDLAAMVGNRLFERGSTLHALINNAGGVRDWYTTTEEGYEYQFALNHLSGFYLTYLLKPFLKTGIVLFTSSYSHYHMRIHWKDVMYQRFYSVLLAYKQSKLANVMTAKELNRRGIRAFAVDPGLVKTDIGDKGTHGLARLVWLMRKRQGTPAEVPAKTYLYLCEHPDATGLYFRDSVSIRYNPQVDQDKETRRLFTLSEQLCGIDFEKEPKP